MGPLLPLPSPCNTLALTEATANFLVNGRMSKAQQIRWS
jgi:hypothetical protein